MERESGKNLSDFSMLDLFRLEAETQLRDLNQRLVELEQEGAHPHVLEALMRAAHSIKGAARMVNVHGAVRIAHRVEDCFVAAQEARLTLDRASVDAILAALDMITSIAAESDEVMLEWDSTHESELRRIEAALEQLLALGHTNIEPEAVVSDSAPILVDAAMMARVSESGSGASLRVAAERLERIMGLVGGLVVEGHRFRTLVENMQRLRRRHVTVARQWDRMACALDRADLSSPLREQLSSLVKATLSLSQDWSMRVDDMETFDRRAITVIDRLHGEILASRMRPFADVVQGFPRMVRDLGRRLEKEVRLEMSGLSTLVDREVLERIDTPLKHLVQNAIDHGMESAAERIEAGKSPTGTLKIAVSVSAGMLFVLVQDDGAGVNPVLLRQKIVGKGLASADQVAAMDDLDLIDYLFVPGFSTRRQVTDISGRGVGLDVVRDAVQALKGSVAAFSEFGKGMQFQILLPLSVSVLRVLLVTFAGESYAFPLARIHRILKIDAAIIEERDSRFFVLVEGEQVELVHANEVFGRPRLDRESGLIPVVILGEQGAYFAVVVETLVGERELAVQKLDAQLGRVRDINAAALVDDGSVTLVIDTDEFLRSIASFVNSHPSDDALHNRAMRPRVLVADDSITARHMQVRLLDECGYQVETVNDGVQAWQRLQHSDFDMLVTDVDMPNLSGFQLLARVRADPRLALLPVLIVSARDANELHDAVRGDRNSVVINKKEFDSDRYCTILQALRPMGKR